MTYRTDPWHAGNLHMKMPVKPWELWARLYGYPRPWAWSFRTWPLKQWSWAFSSLGEELKHLNFHEISWNHPDLKRWKPWNNRETQLHTIVYKTGTALRILKITILGTNIAIFAVGHVFVLLAPSLEMRSLIRDLHKWAHVSSYDTWNFMDHSSNAFCASNTSHAHSLKLEYSNRSNWRFGTPVPSGVSSMATYQLFFISIQIRGFSSQPHILVGGFNLPLSKILLRQLGLLSPIYGKKCSKPPTSIW